MHSSISNFKDGKNVRSSVTLIVCVATLCAFYECGLRAVRASISINERHLYLEIPAELKRLDEAKSTGTVAIAFLGNSHTRRSIDAELIEKELPSRIGRPCTVVKLHPDASGLLQWYFMLSKIIRENNFAPTLLCVGFRDRVLWETRPPYGVLAQNLVSLRDWDQITTYLAPGVEDQLEFLASYASLSIAYRDKIKKRILYMALPSFEELSTWMRGDPGEMTIPSEPPVILEPFLALCRTNHIDVVFWRVPTLGPPRDQAESLTKLKRLFDSYGVPFFVPCADVELKETLFMEDRSHTNEAGQELATRRWIQYLEDWYKQPQRPNAVR